jgi:SAM-dependent methyltransferase
MDKKKIKKAVQDGYARIAKKKASCCGASCCGSTQGKESLEKEIGYTDKDIHAVPEGANMGLGCGNPVALASLKEGETVLDLGSGGGFDCFLAANKVGKTGKVIGIDMTPEMIKKARANATKGKYTNVEFRRGEIEHLPVDDNSVDIIISNCVINLSPEKEQVFREAFRVLKHGGRVMVSDLVLLKKLHEEIRESVDAYIGCLAGATLKDEYLKAIQDAGFVSIKIIGEAYYPVDLVTADPTAQTIIENIDLSPEKLKEIAESISSIKVYAEKP